TAIDQRGFRAYQSTPLVSRHGVLLGALCTLCRRPRLVGDRDQRILDLLARQAADFIDRKQAHEQLAQSESRMRAILDGVADAIVTIDARGMIGERTRPPAGSSATAPRSSLARASAC
ncbi:MAG: GAF domain-containing protein, partial [Proteobacteria bacterium]|nr:GAF domain-containing protein [Pseudomonadota bacterium]